MAKRPTTEKKLRRLRKALRRTPPAFIDLVAWLKLHGYADTTGKAHKIILDGRVRSESHKLGIGRGVAVKKGKLVEVDEVHPMVSADIRGTIVVVDEVA